MTKIEKEQTLILIKPDGVQRSLVGEVVRRIERSGLKLVALKMLVPTPDQLTAHYHKDDAWFLEKGERIASDRKEKGLPADKEPIEYGRAIIDQLVTFMTSGPIIAMVVQGNRSVAIVKKLVGVTEPVTSDVGTIRGDYTVDSYEHAGVQERAVRNLVHCSDQPQEAEREIAVWFKPEEIIKYRLVSEQILYDVNLDGLLE